VLLGFIALVVVTAYYPFDWDPPRMVRNDATRTAGGTIRLGERNAAISPGSPPWLDQAKATGKVEVELEARPQATQVDHPVSLVLLGRDYWHTDFALGQDRGDLVVWLRRTGSDDNGDPGFVIPDVFQTRRWTTVQLRIYDGELRIDVDATTRLLEPVPDDTVRRWGDGRVAFGRELHGSGPWQGEVRKAEVRTRGAVVDYLRPGALKVPNRYFYMPDHIAPFPPDSRTEWAIVLLHLLSFVPIGFLVVAAGRPPLRLLPATLLTTATALALGAGKFLFRARHTALADVTVEIVGGFTGVLVARWAVGRGAWYVRQLALVLRAAREQAALERVGLERDRSPRYR
jgi:hypothetical protein